METDGLFGWAHLCLACSRSCAGGQKGIGCRQGPEGAGGELGSVLRARVRLSCLLCPVSASFGDVPCACVCFVVRLFRPARAVVVALAAATVSSDLDRHRLQYTCQSTNRLAPSSSSLV